MQINGSMVCMTIHVEKCITMQVEGCITLKQAWSCAWGRGTLILRSIDKALKRYIRNTIMKFAEGETHSDASIFPLFFCFIVRNPCSFRYVLVLLFSRDLGWTPRLYERTNSVLHKCGEWHGTRSTKRFYFWNWEMSFRPGIEPTPEHSKTTQQGNKRHTT